MSDDNQLCPIAISNAAEILKRASVGYSKYGHTCDRGDLTEEDWIQHAKEEALDLANYLEKLKREIIRLKTDLKQVREEKKLLISTVGKLLTGTDETIIDWSDSSVFYGSSGKKYIYSSLINTSNISENNISPNINTCEELVPQQGIFVKQTTSDTEECKTKPTKPFSVNPRKRIV